MSFTNATDAPPSAQTSTQVNDAGAVARRQTHSYRMPSTWANTVSSQKAHDLVVPVTEVLFIPVRVVRARTPSSSAIATPVSIARFRLEVMMCAELLPMNARTPAAAARAWRRPSAFSEGSGPPRPSNVPAAVRSVTPWRTSTILVGAPGSAEDLTAPVSSAGDEVFPLTPTDSARAAITAPETASRTSAP